MKKLLSIILLFMLLNTVSYADTSTNNFNLGLLRDDIPQDPPTPGGGGGGGLSGGAITAIAIGGVAAAGLALLIKTYLSKGYCTGSAAGVESPIVLMCLDRSSVEKLKTNNQDNPYLVKALSMSEINPCPGSKYLLVPDTFVANGQFNVINFSIPMTQVFEIKITQVSDKVGENDFTTEIYVGLDKVNKIPFTTTLAKDGVVQKVGRINPSQISSSNIATLLSPFKSTADTKNLRYAYVIEFKFVK